MRVWILAIYMQFLCLVLELDYSISSCLDKVRIQGTYHWKTTSPGRKHRGLHRFYLMKSTQSQDKVKQIASMSWITKWSDHPGSHLNFKGWGLPFSSGFLLHLVSDFSPYCHYFFFAYTYTPRNMIGLNMLLERYDSSSYLLNLYASHLKASTPMSWCCRIGWP